MLDSTKVVFAIAGAFLTGAVIFGMVGYYGRDMDFVKSRINPDYVWEMAHVDPMRIRDYLLELSSEPHMAGLDRDELLAEFVAEEWRNAGLDHVKVEGYKMLLDYPDKDSPNLIKIFNGNGELMFTSHFKEDGVDHPNFVDAFNAYSKPGTVEGVPVYVNFGRVEDFDLIKELNVDVKGKVCMAMYGNGFRGNKAENAAQAGCVGLIIFSDPKDVAQNGTEPSQVYPNTFWLPGTGMQRGSLALADGDPLTPNWPSLDNVYKLDQVDRQKYLPQIPVQPIGYTDAEQILNKLGGKVAPDEWQGKIPGITYRLGGQFSSQFNGSRLELTVNNKMEERVSSNVVGIIYGDVEPDKYVMIGNHRDAWGFGALDPSSGTAQLLEVVRVLGEKKKTQGWRPRRTMIFLNWGAEEYSLCGSREFVEQYIKQLEQRGVAYINTDVCMSGPILLPSGSPTISGLIVEATKDIYSPENDDESYYDFWRRWAEVPNGEEFEPEIKFSPGAGSDHASFIYLAGVPVIDIMFESDPHKWKISGYPAYHTGYETMRLVDQIYDPDFKMFRACSQLNLRLGLQLADSPLLPFNLTPYADVMENAMVGLDKNGVIVNLNGLGIETVHFNDSVYAFREAVVAWKEYVDALDITNPMTLRYINDQIVGFEKTFLLPEGLPDRTQYRHAVIAPSLFDAYGGSAFPGLGDLLYNIDNLGEEDRAKRIKTLKRHVSDLMIVVRRAAEFLRPVEVL